MVQSVLLLLAQKTSLSLKVFANIESSLSLCSIYSSLYFVGLQGGIIIIHSDLMSLANISGVADLRPLSLSHKKPVLQVRTWSLHAFAQGLNNIRASTLTAWIGQRSDEGARLR